MHVDWIKNLSIRRKDEQLETAAFPIFLVTK